MTDNPQAHTSPLVYRNSPINLLAKFVGLMRHRFATGNTPWKFDEDESQTGIFIDSELNINTGYTNQSPAIVVSRGSVIHQKSVLADRDQNNVSELRTGGKYSYGTAEADIRMECIGQSYGESATLGDIVQSTITMTLREITRAFTLRDIGPVVLSPTAPLKRDEEKYVTYVDFRVYSEHRWYNIDASPVLKAATLHAEKVSAATETAVVEAVQSRPSNGVVAAPIHYESVSEPALSPTVLLHSPLSILGKFSDFLRVRFSHSNLPWVYSPNDADTQIFVYPEYTRATSASNLSPALIVSRGSTVHTKAVVGDQAEASPVIAREAETGYVFGETDIRIACVGQSYGESAILADVVQSAITMSRAVITKAFTLRDIMAVVQGPTTPYPRDEEKYVTYVDFRVSFEQKWFTIPIAPVLKEADLLSGQG